MGYQIENKLVIAVASSALFDLTESDQVFREKGEEEYRNYQHEHEHIVLKPGVVFPLIKRLLSLNGADPADQPIEVVLMSKNDPDTGLRVFKSIEHYGLGISRAAFVTGADPFRYMDAFNAALFFSASEQDVRHAVERGLAAAQVFPSQFVDDDQEQEVRLAFDFDGIIADDSAEQVFQRAMNLDDFYRHEKAKADEMIAPGPIFRFFRAIAGIQRKEREQLQQQPGYKVRLKIAIVTARNAPAHERVIKTLRAHGIIVDEAFFLGGIDKSRILKMYKPHIFFDDQVGHLVRISQDYPCAHVPFGIVNQRSRNA